MSREEDISMDENSTIDEEISWISWFCSLKGNEFFCEIDEDFITDDFNLTGLSVEVPFYEYALDMILDLENNAEEELSEEQQQMVESSADILYGLIHSRYILTTRGISQMEEKYKKAIFGRCPRVYCQGHPVLPVGQSDKPREGSVKLYCPKCNEIYYPKSNKHRGIDGAYWGTTFPHIFLLVNPDLKAPKSEQSYTPKIFGFRVNKKALYKIPEEKKTENGQS
eukprot:gene1074-10593_t